MVCYQSCLLIDICIREAQRLDFKNCQGSARSDPVMWLIAQFLSFREGLSHLADPNTPNYLTKL